MTKALIALAALSVSMGCHAEQWWAYVTGTSPPSQDCSVYTNDAQLYAALIEAAVPEEIAGDIFPDVSWQKDVVVVARRNPKAIGLPRDVFVDYKQGSVVLNFMRSPDIGPGVVVVAISRGQLGKRVCSTRQSDQMAAAATFTSQQTTVQGGGKFDTNGWSTESSTTVAPLKNNCRKYAERAVQQYKSSQARQCGIPADNRWSGSYEHHYAWCIDTRFAKAPAETAVRDKLLQTQCK